MKQLLCLLLAIKLNSNNPTVHQVPMYWLLLMVPSYNVHCNMEEFCGSEGGWTRLAYLDMTDSTVNCPSGFQLFQSGGVRACGRPTSSGGSCIPIQFPSNGISYSQVCGRVTGYQWGLTDAVHWTGRTKSQ